MTHSFSFEKNQFERMFPFYVLIDRDLRIVSSGKSLTKVFPLQSGELFSRFFSIPRPKSTINSFDDLVRLQHQLIALELI